MYSFIIKRIIDVIMSLFAIIILSPILIAIIILLFIINDRNPFFYQERPGKNSRLFRMIKFKTMNDKCDINGNLLPNVQRITKVGRWMRKLSLDELPQLINILKGDMSLVGPRPLLVEYLNKYNEDQALRHNVKPGITGWAQVNGRNAISWDKKFEYDVWYVNHVSFKLDVKIFFLTVLKVLRRDGVNAAENVTMEKFIGNFKNK